MKLAGDEGPSIGQPVWDGLFKDEGGEALQNGRSVNVKQQVQKGQGYQKAQGQPQPAGNIGLGALPVF